MTSNIENLRLTALFAVLLAVLPLSAAAQQTETVSVADLGCFADNQAASPNEAAGHDLDGALFSQPTMTVQTCFSLCYQQGFKFAGLQDGSQCFCGDAYGRYGSAVGACNTPCAGDPSQSCGGTNANHVYEFVTTQVNDAPPTPSSPTTGAQPPAPSESMSPVPEFDSVSRTAIVFPVGKWPEGIAWDGTSLWVAESGQRQLARLALNDGSVLDRVKVGRLPVGLVGTPDGRIYAAVATDRTIWQQDGSDGGALAELRNYPKAIAADDSAVFVLTWVDGGSSQTQVVRIDPATGKRTHSPILPRNGFDLALSGDLVWVLHRFDGDNRCELIALDRTNLAVVTRASFNGFATFLTAGSHGLFAAGGEFGKTGLVARFDPVTGQELARTEGIGFVASIATDGKYVIAVESGGAIEILAAHNLSRIRSIDLSSGGVAPQNVLPLGERLFITTHQGSGGKGSVIVIDDWRP